MKTFWRRKHYTPKRKTRKHRFLQVVPYGTQYSIETMNCTFPCLFTGNDSYSSFDFPTNLPWNNIVGNTSFPTFERYKLLNFKVKFIPGPAFYNSTPQYTENTPPFFGGVHMASYHTDLSAATHDLGFINKFKDAKHFNPYTDRNMTCYWIPNIADSGEQDFKPLPIATQASNWDHGGVVMVIEGTNVINNEAQGQIIGEFQITFKVILIGKLSVSFQP